jgi:secondary thiamine-phosphate synthase enzyme
MELTVKTNARSEMIDITAAIHAALEDHGIQEGRLLIFVPHTTAGVTINESADPDVRADITQFLDRLVPWDAGYRHLEGNSAAHIKASLVGASQHVAVQKGRMRLGTWQGIFFCEFDGPRTRSVFLSVQS